MGRPVKVWKVYKLFEEPLTLTVADAELGEKVVMLKNNQSPWSFRTRFDPSRMSFTAEEAVDKAIKESTESLAYAKRRVESISEDLVRLGNIKASLPKHIKEAERQLQQLRKP